ncbi:hypothetical protein IWW48_002893 [Coemansia sp. RSA 1200]|nr:hypothetical protein IWW48_002893 [Coemansia sp. RSA 1200]
MDLLSGIPAVLVALGAALQVMHSPTKVAYNQLQQFLDWLQKNIEQDFFIRLCACEGKCQTEAYKPNKENVENRIRANVGNDAVVGCIGKNILSVEDLIEIVISDNSGHTLVQLARLVRYPGLTSFARAVRVVQFCPTFGRRVIFWQWIVMAVNYLAFWLFKGGFPNAVYWGYRVMRNVFRRALYGLPPLDSAHRQKRVGDYCIAELARHRIVGQHIPWVRFSIYYMAMEMAGKHMSVGDWKSGFGQDKTAGLLSSALPMENMFYKHAFQEYSDNRGNSYDNSSGRKEPKNDFTNTIKPNEESRFFKSQLFHERLLCAQTTTDRCSAARLLFSVALHSTRVMILCGQLGFVPPYVLTSSFRTVDHALCGTMMVVQYNNMDVLYSTMYCFSTTDDALDTPFCEEACYEHAIYNSLVKSLQSRLGDMIKKSSNICILINLTMFQPELDDVDQLIKAAGAGNEEDQSEISSLDTPQLFPPRMVDGVIVDSEIYTMLLDGYVKANERLAKIITNLAKATTNSIHWGCGTWVLCLFDTAFSENYNWQKRIGDYHMYSCVQTVRVYFRLLGMLPYQLNYDFPALFDDSKANFDNINNIYEVEETYWSPLNDSKYCNSVPAWCMCSGHCRGICTLLIGELEMCVSFENYSEMPYVFELSSQIEAETEAAKSAPEYSSSIPIVTTFRLVCVTKISYLTHGNTSNDIAAPDYPQLPACLEDGHEKIFTVGKQENGNDNGASKLAEMLYSKEGHVVVICGNTMRARGGEATNLEDDDVLIWGSNSRYSTTRWPYNFDFKWKNHIRRLPLLRINPVERLRLYATDNRLAQTSLTEATRPQGILNYSRNANRKSKRTLRYPFRNIVEE